MQIQLSKEEIDFCSYSPAEIILYYIAYPQQLVKDASVQSKDTMEYFFEMYKKAEEYMKNKN